MLVSVVPIGNSKGIRLPKTILDQLNISDTLDMEVDNQQIILKPIANTARKGWEKAFKKMHEQNEDQLLINDTSNSERFEWEW
jgi:antitoxin MazE